MEEGKERWRKERRVRVDERARGQEGKKGEQIGGEGREGEVESETLKSKLIIDFLRIEYYTDEYNVQPSGCG